MTADPAPAPIRTVATTSHTDLRVHGVTFGYSVNTEPVLTDFDLDVPEGDHLAVVGPSGAGKSTLARLLAGLHQPITGQVLLGGVPAHEVDPAPHRALIPQEAYVFAGPLRDNLTYLRPEATDHDVMQAAARLGLTPLIDRLGGLGAEVAPGHLSAGERQLIAATRTYLAPAQVIILDEATCHLDPDAEARVEQAFADRPGTLIVIAHRLSSALRAKHVLVLDGPRYWHGRHRTLEQSCPVYRELIGFWNSAAPPPRRSHPPTRETTDLSPASGREPSGPVPGCPVPGRAEAPADAAR
jgi:ATP-binding cassette subfamily C protein